MTLVVGWKAVVQNIRDDKIDDSVAQEFEPLIVALSFLFAKRIGAGVS